MTVYTILPQDDLNLEVTVNTAEDPVVLNITPAAVSVTSAVLSVNSATGVVTLDTDDISEGTANLYYTDARADARVDLQTGAYLDLSFADTDELAEGPTNLYYTNARTQTVITANTEAFIKADSTDTLTNKSGNVSQFTNDAGYITSQTDAQTLSLSQPNLTISNGNTVDLTPLVSDYITASTTDTLTNKSGNISQWTNDSAYLVASALTPYYTSTQTDALPVSTFSNDAGYSTTTGTVTPTSTDTFTNKSGNISQWTNDAGYLTSETDNQTLSFATPNLSISSGNSVDLSDLTTTTLAWSTITATPTTLSGYGITDGVTADSTTAFTNKSGNISQWTNDAGYLTAETDSQTLSLTTNTLAISNGNSVDLSTIAVDETDGGTF